MAAVSLSVRPYLIPDLRYDAGTQTQFVNDSLAYRIDTKSNIRTLASYNFGNIDVIQGLLFTPNIATAKGCGNETTSIVPFNATFPANLPPGSPALIALAPWTTPACVSSMLVQIRQIGAVAALVFHPDGGSDTPPSASDDSWNINDGNAWRNMGGYPIYAIPDTVARAILQQSSQYSGNMTQAPFAENLTAMYNTHDYIRLYARLDIASAINIPSLWIFLIIVLAILLAVVLATSFVMHIIQRRQRYVLQRRVANGEVDLEILGIKRLSVPQEVLDKMPRYTYAPVDEAVTKAFPNRSTLNQPICAICLDDFVDGETQVRELPCNHIFHPDCIDPFLKNNSSLCPLCKKSSLPKGCCPIQVTNVMVRRERLVRRLREQQALVQQMESGEITRRGRFTLARYNAGQRFQELYWPSAPPPVTLRIRRDVEAPEDTELQSTTPAVAATPADAPVNVPGPSVINNEVPEHISAQGTEAIRAWRLAQLADERDRVFQAQGNDVERIERRTPRWKRVLGRVFPVGN